MDGSYDAAVQHYEQGRRAQALELFRRHTGERPSDPRGFVAVGVILEEQGDIEQAIEQYRIAVRLEGAAESHLKLGRTLRKLRGKGLVEEEQAEYERAVELDPRCSAAWHELADVRQFRGVYDEAEAASQEAIRLDPGNARYHYRLALSLFFGGHDARADKALQTSNELAIDRWGHLFDGPTAGRKRKWFVAPQPFRELFADRFGELYGQRAPNVAGAYPWPLPSLLYRQQRVHLVRLENVYLEGLHGLVYDKDHVFASQHVTIQGVWRFFVEAPPQHPRQTTKLDKLASLHQPDWANYYHWTIECLTRLLLLEETLEADPHIKLLVPAQKGQRYIGESLKMLGVDPERCVVSQAGRGRRYFARELFYADWQWPLSGSPSPELAAMWYPPREGLRRLHRRLAGTPLSAADRRRIIYVRRKPDEVRGVRDDSGLIASLRKRFGERFVVFDAEQQTLRDQIELFKSARVVFGPHGAGLTNILFCAPGTAVIEFPIVPSILNHFAHLALALDLDYWVTPPSTHYLGHYELDAGAGQRIVSLVEQLAG